MLHSQVPAFETSDGLCLNEANAIAYYVANTQLHGGPSREDAARVSQWVHFTDNEILPAVCTWVFPCMGVMQYNKQVCTFFGYCYTDGTQLGHNPLTLPIGLLHSGSFGHSYWED